MYGSFACCNDTFFLKAAGYWLPPLRRLLAGFEIIISLDYNPLLIQYDS
jgi:hypothetical protein